MKLNLIFIFIFTAILAFAADEITPYKYTDQERKNGMPVYEIPPSCRFTTKRQETNAPDIIYYLSKPKNKEGSTLQFYPILVFCGGSTSQDDISSIIHLHRYYLQEFLDLGAAVLTVEQWGVDGNKVDKKVFMEHYTRSQRLRDHEAVINHLKSDPPQGWNRKFIFFGVSEGGPIATTLATQYPNMTTAVISWSGMGDWSWREQLWTFLQQLKIEDPTAFQSERITSRSDYDARMNETLHNPTADKYFCGMTYQYHADAMTYPKIDYLKISMPFLAVAGAKDSFIASSDAFVEKAKKAGANITYFRVPDMDHYVRKRPDIVQQTFDWLRNQLL